MKTIIKLIVIGVIAGLTFNHLSDKQLDVKETAQNFIAIVKQKFSLLETPVRELLEKDDAVREDNGNSTNTKQVARTGNQSSGQSKPQGDIRIQDRKSARQQIDLTGTDVRAYENKIPSKNRQNNERFRELDFYAASVPADQEANMDLLVKYLVKPAKNKVERTRLVFSWIAQNVSYDDYGYNTGHYADVSAEGVFKNRVAVCQGFSELFKVMGEKAGLDIVLVTGYAKGISYRSGQSFNDTNHAWNLVYLGNNWRHFDVTWAQGYGTAVNRKLVSIKKFDGYWFNTPADEFIFSHYPENPKWQLSSVPLTLEQYEKLPSAGASFFKMGFDGTQCLQNAFEGTLREFPESYLNDGSLIALSLPHNKEIQANQPITIRLRSNGPTDIAIINNGEWIHLRKDGNEYMAVVNPQPGGLKLSARLDQQSTSYNTLLEYRVN